MSLCVYVLFLLLLFSTLCSHSSDNLLATIKVSMRWCAWPFASVCVRIYVYIRMDIPFGQFSIYIHTTYTISHSKLYSHWSDSLILCFFVVLQAQSEWMHFSVRIMRTAVISLWVHFLSVYKEIVHEKRKIATCFIVYRTLAILNTPTTH